ncbi:hypothetical protein HAALTHF_04350n [Vreelandella aquamarina]|nr:hypothetical protein HAALTHF_04350n [Halomonas axialensis]
MKWEKRQPDGYGLLPARWGSSRAYLKPRIQACCPVLMGRIVKAFTPLKPSMARGRMLPSRKGFLAVKAKNDLILIIFFRGANTPDPK